MDKWQQVSSYVSQHPHNQPEVFKRQFVKMVRLRWVSENSLALILQYVGLMFSTLTPFYVPLWFATGTAVALLFSKGYSILPGLFLGTVLAFYFSNSSIPIALACGLIFCLQAVGLLYLSYRFIGPSLVFYKLCDFLKFIFVSIVISLVTCALLLALTYTSLKQHPDFFLLSWQWTVANLNGIFAFSCAIFAWDTYFPQINRLKNLSRWPLAFLYGFIVIFSIVLLFSKQNNAIWMSSSILLILMMVASFYYKWPGAVASVALLGFILSVGARSQAPVFTLTPHWVSFIFIPLFIWVCSVIGLGISAKMAPSLMDKRGTL